MGRVGFEAKKNRSSFLERGLSKPLAAILLSQTYSETDGYA